MNRTTQFFPGWATMPGLLRCRTTERAAQVLPEPGCLRLRQSVVFPVGLGVSSGKQSPRKASALECVDHLGTGLVEILTRYWHTGRYCHASKPHGPLGQPRNAKEIERVNASPLPDATGVRSRRHGRRG
jgi:hypothetical protein